MPLQNRVTPFGDIIATPERGTLMGNRGGPLHDSERKLGISRWRNKTWITCLLEFKGRRRKVMAPGLYTELFFLDEVTALAAGHRPCGECRREDYLRFVAAWAEGFRLHGTLPKAYEVDAFLHEERINPKGRDKRVHLANLDALPDMTMIVLPDRADEAFVVLGDSLRSWSPGGYGSHVPRPRGLSVRLLTPPSIVRTFEVGYVPDIHESAKG